jgi:hypothetical protein
MNKIYAYLLGLLLYLFYLIGVFKTEINGLSLIFAFILFILILSSKEVFISKKSIYFIIAFNLIVILCFSFNIRTDYSVYKTEMLLLKFNTLFLIPQLLKKDLIYNFLKGLFSMLLIVTLIFFFYSFRSLGQFDYNNRLELGIINPIWITRISLELLFIYIIALKKSTIKTVLLIIIILPIVYASGSKGPVFAFIFSFFAYYLSFNKISLLKLKYAFSSIVFVFLLVVIYTFVIKFDTYFTQRFLTLVPDSEDINALEENRSYFIPIILNNFFNQDWNTILFGSGIGNTSKIFYGKYVNDRFYPHNILVEILCEFGLIFLFWITTLVIIFYNRNKSPLKFIFLFFILNAMFSGDIILNEFIFLYAGIILSTNNLTKKNESNLSDNGKLLSRTYN